MLIKVNESFIKLLFKHFAATGSKVGTILIKVNKFALLSELDLFCASYNISLKGFYFEGNFKPEVLFMQVDDG